MSKIIYALLTISIMISIIDNRVNDLSDALLTECANAVTLCISITGSMCLWSGVMRVAKDCGIIKFLSKAARPILGLLFPGLNPDSAAAGYIILNLLSNFLGLGNASTPLGIKAMQELDKENPDHGVATDSMIMLAVLNTASLQLFPATVAAIRGNYGAVSPADIIPAVWITSVYCFTISVTTAKLCSFFTRLKRKKKV